MPSNTSPFEVVAAPLKVYVAPVGTTFPDVDQEEGDLDPAWLNLGTQTSRNYTDSGVEVEHSEETEDFVPAGSTMAIKRFRTGESFMISLELADISPDTYALVMNNATVTDIAAGTGIPGESSFSLFRGDQVAVFAVCARGPSSVVNTLFSQYEFSRAHVSVNGPLTWNKGEPVALPVEIMATKYADLDVILFRVGTAPAS